MVAPLEIYVFGLLGIIVIVGTPTYFAITIAFIQNMYSPKMHINQNINKMYLKISEIMPQNHQKAMKSDGVLVINQ